jgi:GTP-binding protein HflX
MMGHAQLLSLWLLPTTALHFAVPGRSGCSGCSGCIIRRRSPPAAMAAFGAETINVEPGAKCYLVGAVVKRDRYKTLVNSWGIDDSLDELQRLCETAGLEVLGRDYQTLQHPSPSTFIGQGKLDEIAALVKSMRVSTVIFDEELTPAQGRNIQNVLIEACGEQVQVLDRTMLILVIFSQRARTSEAKLQVAAAQMKYMLPRLKFFLTQGAGMDAKGGSGGGMFLKGSGETQLEEDRRLFRKQLGKIEDDLAAVQAHASAHHGALPSPHR